MNHELIPVKQLVIKTRIETCENCPIFSQTFRNCRKTKGGCGCVIDVPIGFGKRSGKAHMMGQSCPKKKWEKVTEEDLLEIHNQLAEEG